MNEKIRDLVLKAQTQAAKETIENSFSYEGKVFEKFAELLIRECVKEIEFQYGGGSDQPMDNEWDRAIECVSSMVKYRFGVEE